MCKIFIGRNVTEPTIREHLTIVVTNWFQALPDRKETAQSIDIMLSNG